MTGQPPKSNLRRRNLATLALIIAFILLIYFINLVRLKAL